MANRYWVGGAGTWNASSSAHWSASSGGAGGASVPTSADAVFFDANSGTGSVTTGSMQCASMDCTGFSGTFINGGGIQVYGNVTLSSAGTYTDLNISFYASGTLDTVAKQVSSVAVYFGSTLTLANHLTCSDMRITGTLTTSNYNITIVGYGTINISNATLNLGNSTLTYGGSSSYMFSPGGGVNTINGASSTINVSSSGSPLYFYGSSATTSTLNFGAVTFAAAASSIMFAGCTSLSFASLTINAPSSTGVRLLNLSTGFSVSGALSISGASPVRRIRIAAVTGPFTISAGSISATSDVDFYKITKSGAAWTGTRLGNLGGNTNITFPAAKTVYWNPPSAADFYSASWAATSGGTSLYDTNIPLAQDTAVIDNNSRAGISNVSVSGFVTGTLNFSGRTSPITLASSSNWLYVAGNVTLGSGVTFSSGVVSLSFGSANRTVTCNGGKFYTLICDTSGVSTLSDSFYCSSTLNIYNGSTVTANSNVTCGGVGFQTGSTLNMGSGTWTLTSTTWSANVTPAPTINKGTSEIIISASSAFTFYGGGLSYGKLTIADTSTTPSVTFTGNNSFTEIYSTRASAYSLIFPSSGTTTIGKWSVSGTASANVSVTASSTAAATLAYSGTGKVSCDYLWVNKITGSPSLTWYVGANSIDGGSNTNVYFSSGIPASSGMFFGSNF